MPSRGGAAVPAARAHALAAAGAATSAAAESPPPPLPPRLGNCHPRAGGPAAGPEILFSTRAHWPGLKIIISGDRPGMPPASL